MRLRPLRLGNCKLRVESSNDQKVKVVKRTDSLTVFPKCICGYKHTRGFSIDSHESKIIEEMTVQRRKSEETGRRLPMCKSSLSTIIVNCPNCNRQYSVTINFVLDKPFLKRFSKQRAEAREHLIYGNMLTLDVSVKNGFFAETRQPRTLAEISHPICWCGTELAPVKLLNDVQHAIDSVNIFWQTGDLPLELKGSERCKCLFCLNDAKIKWHIKPILPKNESIPQIIGRHESWLTRAQN